MDKGTEHQPFQSISLEDNRVAATFPFRCDEIISCPGAVHQTCGCTDHANTEEFAIVFDIGQNLNQGESEESECQEENVEFTGPNVQHDYNVKTWHECGEKCKETDECNYWTFSHHSGESHGCFLKSEIGEKKKNKEGFRSGSKDCAVEKGKRLYLL